ncbi:MAG: glycosyltransferase [Candidatus Solibacter usitatus]|nr:glycosyltransferase [Candidatus Solibacter usitatus]
MLTPRVALFSDSFHEVNGVALTCRRFEEFALRRGLPLLSVHAGPRFSVELSGSVLRCEIPSSPVGFKLEQDLRFDLLWLRHRRALLSLLRGFAPDLVHITGPNHPGLLGALLAHQLRLPLAASWHTNVHQYAGRRLARSAPARLAAWAESAALALTLRFYSLARLLFAPNPELAHLLSSRTSRPCHLMRRGVDCLQYAPSRRSRTDETLVIGYVGRLSPEKSVRRLAEVERAILQAGFTDFRIEIAGNGSEREWLHANVSRLRDHGILHGKDLARAYAGFDIFAFPSETDTYGNVVQEAMASAVPCVVTSAGGPAHIVSHGHDGIITTGPADFCRAVVDLALDAALRSRLAVAARRSALAASWDAVFESVYQAYAGIRPCQPVSYDAYLELENRPL